MLIVKDVLSQAADLIEPPGCWTRRAAARNLYGVPCEPTETLACSFCIIGAVSKIAGGYSQIRTDALHEIYTALHIVKPGSTLSEFNDDPETTQEQAVALLREAAAQHV